jgi:hypothetical protein
VDVLPNPRFVCCYVLTLSLLFAGCANNNIKSQNVETATSKSEQGVPAVPVYELSLREFYKFPAGPRGLEPTEKLLRLKDNHVRIRGYMVKEEEPTAGLFMLAPLPVSLAEKEDGPADNLPAATLFVHLPTADAHKVVAYHPGIWELTGTLKLGNHEEANGRISYAQLILD